MWSCNSPVETAVRPQSITYQIDTLKLQKGRNAEMVYLDFEIHDLKLDSKGDTILERMADSIQHRLLLNNLNSETSAPSYQALFDSLVVEFQRLSKAGIAVFGPWMVSQNIRIATNQRGILSLISTHSSFTGGAHAMVYQNTQCYRLADGAFLSLDSLVLPGMKTDLRFLAESYFRQANDFEEQESLNSRGFWFEDDQFYLPENFTYDALGLHFYFNPYDIGPYAMGSFTVDLPYSLIEAYLKPEYHLMPSNAEAPES